MGSPHMKNMTLIPLQGHFFFASQMSQTLKDHIWGQLVFGYIVK
jgi:hypothetical protein